MKRRWRILHLTAAVAETSGQYNEHCLPLLSERDLSLCSFHLPAIEPRPEIACFHGGGTSFGFLRALRAALARGREYDVIHAHYARAALLFLLSAGLLRPRLLSSTVYTVQNCYPNYHWANRLLLAPIFAAYRRVVVCSEATRDSMPAWLRRVVGSRMRVVRNAVHVERVTQAAERGRKSRSESTFVVVSVGRLIEIKNPLTVLDAFTRVAEPNWSLHFIGEGALRSQLRAAADSSGLGKQVHTTGLLPRDQVFEALGAADLFVSASRGEGLPVAVLEAMACGLPVILSGIPPHREVVGDASFVPLVEPEDVEGFARWMRSIRSLSTARRDEIGGHCRKHVEERFGLQAMHAAYERIYEEICGARASTSADTIPMEAR